MIALKSVRLLSNIVLRISKNRTFSSSNNFQFQEKSRSLFRYYTNSRIENDVVLFTSENSFYFLCMNSLSIINCIFFTYMGHFTYTTLKNLDIEHTSSFWKWVHNFGKRHGPLLSALCIFFGLSVAPISFFYTSRSVKKLILQKGGKNLVFITYKIPGLNNNMIVPIKHVSACCSRKKAKDSLPLKIKDKWFYYLLDKSGNFKNPSLFDFTAGVNRNF